MKTSAKQRKSAFSSVADAVATVKRGGLIIVVDDEARENEGDLVCAADKITPALINFMARNGRGLICVTMDNPRAARLGLTRQTRSGAGPQFGTAFTESVDARYGVTTGISAFDRAKTIQVIMDKASGPGDLARPGHLFPIVAADGGVLVRAGHTEASVDLARMAGLKPAGVICEILRADGRMARRPELVALARKHRIPIITIADLIHHRRCTEKLVERVQSVQLPTEYGTFKLHLYHSFLDNTHHLALVLGRPARQSSALVRIHSECLTGDVFGSQRCDCGSQLRQAMATIAREGHGVILYMRQEGRGIGLVNKLHAYALQEKGMDTVDANIHLGFEADLRDYGSGAQILADLGLHKIRLMTNNPRKIEGLERYGLEIVQRVSLVVGSNTHNIKYLRTKRCRLGHLLPASGTAKGGP